jgi:hypothetical protein
MGFREGFEEFKRSSRRGSRKVRGEFEYYVSVWRHQM